MLNFSDFESDFSSKNKENNFRKAGEVFSNQNNKTSSQSNSGGSSSNYSKWMSFMGGLNNKPSIRKNPSPTSNESTSNTVTSQPAGNPIDYEGGYSNWTSDDWIKAYETNNDVSDTWNEELISTYADGRQEKSGRTSRMNMQRVYQDKIDQAKWLESYQGPTTWDETFAPGADTSQYKGNLHNLNKYNAAVKAKDTLSKQYEEWSKNSK